LGLNRDLGACPGGIYIEDGVGGRDSINKHKREYEGKKRRPIGVWVGGCYFLTTWLVVEILRCASNLVK
jgi:hypothetical protein